MSKNETIIQILIAPDNHTFQGRLLGLSDKGNVYAFVGGEWVLYAHGLDRSDV